MGALRNPLATPPASPLKKPVRAATKLNKFGRDPQSLSEKLRVSDYDKDT